MTRGMWMPGARLRLLGPVALVVLAAVLYFPPADSFWLYDDPALLKQIVVHGIWANFFVPEVWRLLSAGNFTPWVLLSLDMDWRLFGLQPFGFYVHHMMSLCLLFVLAYGVLRRWFSAKVCLMGLALFLLSPPLAESARLLMERHYIEGLLFSLASIHFFMESGRKDSLPHAALGAALYLAAAASKEIYVPLPFLLPFLLDGGWRRRAAYTAPWVVVFLGYLSWRYYMLGRLTGGYGLALAWPGDFVSFPGRVATAMGGGSEAAWWKWLIFASSLGLVFSILTTGGKKLFVLIAASALVVGPLIPVSPIMATRYVWLLFFCWLVVHMIAWDGLNKAAGRISAGVIIWLWFGVLAACFVYMGRHGQMRSGGFNQQAAEGRFVLRGGAGSDLLVNPAASGWYYSDLSWLRENVLRLPPGPAATADARIMCFELMAGKTGGAFVDRFTSVWQFDPAGGVLVRRDLNSYMTANCGGDGREAIRAEAPLTLRLAAGDSMVSWQFGPYHEGQYSLFLGRASESLFVLPETGARSVSFRGQQIYCRLKYVSPEGWTTYSPLLKFDVGGDDRGLLLWERITRQADPAVRDAGGVASGTAGHGRPGC